MNKGFEALERLVCCDEELGYSIECFDRDLNIVKKELRALEIIKEKGIDVEAFKNYQTVIAYNWSIRFERYKRKELIQEEFDLLKEMLKYD